MFPNIAEREETFLIEDLRDESVNDFHLNYDEHLKPFIYETISAIDREIVESHVEVCTVCREDLRDILSFHRELEQEKEIRELSKAGWWTTLADRFFTPNHKTVWLAFASIIFIIGAGLIWFLVSRSSNEIVQIPTNSGNFQTNQIVPPTNSNQAVIEPKQNTNLPKANTNTANQNTDLPQKEIEMASLVFPKALKNLLVNESETLRGNDDAETQKISPISPNGEVIRGFSPVLSWQNIPNLQTFEVTIFDNDFNRVVKSDAVSGNSWRVPNLAKGKIYQWQVTGKTVSADGKTTNYLGQGKFYIVSERDENRINQAKNSLEKGRAFAETGLLREAADEFRKYLKENPNSENAKKFLRQVGQQ